MEQKLAENINLLIKDGGTFEKIGFSILFSSKHNDFSHLGNYIDFYNGLKSKLKAKYIKDSTKCS
jgi:hypothetical protein